MTTAKREASHECYMLNGSESRYEQDKIEAYIRRHQMAAPGAKRHLTAREFRCEGVSTNVVVKVVSSSRRSTQKIIQAVGGVGRSAEGDLHLVQYYAGFGPSTHQAKLDSLRNILVQLGLSDEPSDVDRLTMLIVLERELRGSSAEELSGKIESKRAVANGFRIEPVRGDALDRLHDEHGITKAALAYMPSREISQTANKLIHSGLGFADDWDGRLFEQPQTKEVLLDLLGRLVEFRLDIASGILVPSSLRIKFSARREQ